jgi:hypothetical protein
MNGVCMTLKEYIEGKVRGKKPEGVDINLFSTKNGSLNTSEKKELEKDFALSLKGGY